MATMKDVAKKADVSTSTVSHVINNTRYVSPELQEKVKLAMEELNYSPHAVARSLRSQKTHTIGVIASDITNPFFARVVRGVESVAEEKENKVIVANTDETAEKEVEHIQGLVFEDRVDGLIIAPTGKNYDTFKKIGEETPLVFVDRKLNEIEANAVLSENEKGAYEITGYLIEQGHDRVAIVLGREDVLTSEERFKGYKNALDDAGLSYDPELTTRGNFKEDGAFHATNKLLSLKNSPTAIFTINNKTTMGALRAIKNSGLSWPGDIAIGGFDSLECIDLIDLPIATIVQKPVKMGIQAAKLLYDQIEGKNNSTRTVRVDVDLVTH